MFYAKNSHNSISGHKIEKYQACDGSLAEIAIYSAEKHDLEKLGLDSAMRLSTVRGIELFTNSDYLFEELYPEAFAKEQQKKNGELDDEHDS